MKRVLTLALLGRPAADAFIFPTSPSFPSGGVSTGRESSDTRVVLQTSISTAAVASEVDDGDDDDDEDDVHVVLNGATGDEGRSATAAETAATTAHIIDVDDTQLFSLPRHETNEAVSNILSHAERTIRGLHAHSLALQDQLEIRQIDTEEGGDGGGGGSTGVAGGGASSSSVVVDSTDSPSPQPTGSSQPDIIATDEPMADYGHDKVFSNSYVDLGKVDTVGFDYDYTLVTYKQELLELIYQMALQRLVKDKFYPVELLDAGLKFDPRFSIRGLAVDKETGWICHLSYTHKVAVAWEGRRKVSHSRLMEEYRGKRALRPAERKKRLKPLNDLFSMAECCLIADVVQFFKDRGIPFCPRMAVHDVLSSIGSTHISGDFHRLVAADPGRYFEEQPHLKDVISMLKASGKRLIFASNSPFWYVDAGMRHVMGETWREDWDVVIVSAGKPLFYTEDSRPFREVSSVTGRVKFKKIDTLEKGEVYTEGCLRELIRCTDWNLSPDDPTPITAAKLGAEGLATPKVLYIGDSLFADLVDAKREFGWTTAAVTPEVGHEIAIQRRTQFVLAQRTIDLLLGVLRSVQDKLGNGLRDEEDIRIIDSVERLVSRWRDQQTMMLGNPFGSVFRARYQPSLFAHSLRRYCDLYMSSVSSLRHYSPQHRFYPSDASLLSHEMGGENGECWDLEDVLEAAPLQP